MNSDHNPNTELTLRHQRAVIIIVYVFCQAILLQLYYSFGASVV
eukprot:COSAG05_NODE_1629_length_4372_cov_4.107653_2_plen_44_part_00